MNLDVGIRNESGFRHGGDPAVSHVDHAVGDGLESGVVGDDNECLSQAVTQVGDDSVNLVAVVRVKASCRLVGENDFWVID